MLCIGCGHELAPTQHGGVEVATCAQCGGMWLGADELLRVVTEVEAVSDAASAPASGTGPAALAGERTGGSDLLRACPVCGVTMERVNYDEASGVMIDSCWDHGSWVDDGELDRIAAWIGGWRGELHAPPPELTDEERQRLDAVHAAEAHAHGPLRFVSSSFSYWRDTHRQAKTQPPASTTTTTTTILE